MKLFNSNIIDLLIRKGLPFVIYSLPDSKETILLVQKSPTFHNTEFEYIEKIQGFVIAEFISAKTNIIQYIKPDFILTSEDDLNELNTYLIGLSDANLPDHKVNGSSFLSKVEYLSKTDYIIDKLKKEELDKIVISRISPMELLPDFKIDKFIESAIKKYPKDFVYLLSSSETGIWAGATPEILFKKSNNHYETNAIAGTRLLNDYKRKKTWGEKEIEEQRLVSYFIEKLLSEIGIKDYESIGPETIAAGNLVHLKTIFKIKLSDLENITGLLIKGLHPTPAVCGLPKARAYKMIENAEVHKRELYTGFLGPWNFKKTSQLFVNLRCAKFVNHKALFYVGGGLTAQSDAKAEWQETVNKMKTLLSVIEKL